MPATIVVAQRSGSPYTATDVAKNIFYFMSIDSNIADYEDYPIAIPNVGVVYSYETWLRFRCDVAPSIRCNNFKIWCSGSIPGSYKVTVNSTDIVTYEQPVNTLSAQGTRVEIKDYTSGNKLSITGDLTQIGELSDFMIFQLEALSSDTPGNYGPFTILYQYDEQ